MLGEEKCIIEENLQLAMVYGYKGNFSPAPPLLTKDVNFEIDILRVRRTPWLRYTLLF
jgi:hypothetical protein